MAALSGFLLFATFSFAFSVPVDTKLQALTDTLSAIERLVRYYKSTYRELNIDGLYGLRVLEGQLGVLLEEFNKAGTDGLPNDITARIRHLQVEATNISEEAVSFVRKGDEEYYKALHFVVGRPWKLWKNQRSLNFSSQWNRGVYLKNKERLTESRSDRCMTQLTGSLGNRSTSCQVTQDCVQLMTSRGLTGYGITHQILWTMLAEQAGCTHTVNALFKKQGSSLEDFQTEFCTNNFLEMIQTVHVVLKENIRPRFQDLFLEQQFVCPNIGFHEFLSSTYLRQILNWQKENGCFGTMPRSGDKKDPDYEYEENSTKGNVNVHKPSPGNLKFMPQNHPNISQRGVVVQRGQKLVQQFSNQDSMKHKLMPPVFGSQGYKAKPLQRGLLSLSSSKTFKSRKLLAEKALSGGCLAHKTAVAAGALVMYLRYLIYPGQPDMFNNQAIIKSRLSAITPLTDNEDVAYALSMGQSLKDIPNGMEKSPLKKDNSVTANRTLLKKDYNQPNALNNNVLAAQLYGKNDKDDYYSNQKLKEDYYDDKNESPEYPKRDRRKLNPDQKMVHFDNGNQDKDNYADEDYKDDDYKDEEREEEDKNDERDYPYYDNNQRKQREEADRIEREDKDQYLNKQDKGDHPNTVAAIEGGENPPGRSESPSLGTVLLGFTVIFCVLLFIVYRFIRTRRVHIRYNLRSLMRL
ncbi:uncharacterized protein LOC133181890 [Saccostrea echinata]|uniref:uncharacterized protein LOC133181890 n=1 Tax=Saccostrea echinata TaxID=191078 RepID=UPI002A8081F2|nr:uncharacterized protein LOC133181890 [Saccostrea echinata]